MKKHAFIVGGTGMLWDVSTWLVEQGWHITVVARNKTKLQKLVKQIKHVTPLSLDYDNTETLRKEIKKTIEKNGKITLVVAWVHSNSKCLQIVDEMLKKYKMFHILGTNMKKVKISAKCEYKTVKLGKKGQREASPREGPMIRFSRI